MTIKLFIDNSRNIQRYHQQRIKTNVDTVVSILFIFVRLSQIISFRK
jgi:hypothetical protein